MKKIFFAIALCYSFFSGNAQQRVTTEQVKFVTATAIANFTEGVSFAYKTGMSLEEFKNNLCGSSEPIQEGNQMIEAAYDYLSKAVSREEIIKTNNGVAAGAALVYLFNEHCRGVDSDGADLFGIKENGKANEAAKEGKCKWYQFFCLVHDFLDWVIANWQTIVQIITEILNAMHH